MLATCPTDENSSHYRLNDQKRNISCCSQALHASMPQACMAKSKGQTLPTRTSASVMAAPLPWKSAASDKTSPRSRKIEPSITRRDHVIVQFPLDKDILAQRTRCPDTPPLRGRMNADKRWLYADQAPHQSITFDAQV